MIRRTPFALLLACALSAGPAAAQSSDTTAAPVRTQALSILPFHALIGFYAGDYEHAVGQTATLGLGASYFSLGEDEDEFTYGTAEAKLRYYPSGDPLRGLSFGLTAGPTFVSTGADFDGEDESYTALGIGFEVARSHIMGVDQRFYYGYGAGGKRLFFTGDEAEGVELVIPTLRLSVGYAF
jgi:hypothetical protein